MQLPKSLPAVVSLDIFDDIKIFSFYIKPKFTFNCCAIRTNNSKKRRNTYVRRRNSYIPLIKFWPSPKHFDDSLYPMLVFFPLFFSTPLSFPLVYPRYTEIFIRTNDYIIPAVGIRYRYGQKKGCCHKLDFLLFPRLVCILVSVPYCIIYVYAASFAALV